MNTQTTNQKNAAFARMRPENKRVAIARDVLAWLRTKKITAAHGVYFKAPTKAAAVRGESFGKKCEVCALGAVFACAVAFSPKISTGRVEDATEYDEGFQLDGGPTMRRKLRGIFSEEQLNLIESAFEGWHCGNSTFDATRFNDGISDPKERMRRIMHNIIRNDGTFKP